MKNWPDFQAAILANNPQTLLLDACDRAWTWLDLSPDERVAERRAHFLSESTARTLAQALSFVRLRLLRDAGIPSDTETTSRLMALDAAYRDRSATDSERQFLRRYLAAWEITQTLMTEFPALAMPPPPPDTRQESILIALPKLTTAMRRCGADALTNKNYSGLQAAVNIFAAIATGWEVPPPADYDWWLGQSALTLGRAAVALGKHDDARAWYARAADHFDAAGEPEKASDCQGRSHDLDLRIEADFDSATERDLRALLEAEDPLAEAQALSDLAGEAHSAGDLFEAGRLAERAAAELVQAGFPDPEPEVVTAVDCWIGKASSKRSGNAFFSLMCQAVALYVSILGARVGDRLKRDPDGARRAEIRIRELASLPSRFGEQAEAARANDAARWAVWVSAPNPETQKEAEPDTDGRQQQFNRLDDALHALRLACNAGASEAQLNEADRLEAEANSLGSTVRVVRAALERAYVLLALSRPAEVALAVDRAIATLVGERKPALSAFSTSYEREFYLTAVNYKARALATLGQYEVLLDLCVPVVDEIETQRWRVSSPYQQSSFLATRTEIYRFCVGAAYRLKRWDQFLAIAELLKSRAALRGRLTGASPAAIPSDIITTFEKTSRELAAAQVGSPEAAALAEQRRWLWNLRAIAKARGEKSAGLPDLTVAAVQTALSPEEAAITWFWVASDVLIVFALTRDSINAEHVGLSESHCVALNEFVAGVRELTGTHRGIDNAVARLGEILLPSATRAFVAGKTRMILCPHRTLHLFPFHAVPWDGGFLIQHAAIGYVPNLGSLILPWYGCRQGTSVAIGTAHFSTPGLADLDDAEREAAEVAANYGAAGTALIAPSRDQFAALPFAGISCLHLATHATSVFSSDELDDPLESRLYFRDGPVDGIELAGLGLSAELVVLSACHSGQRAIAGRGLEDLPGDDLFGLQGALFQSGVRTVLGALWPVESRTARAIVTAFHRHHAGGLSPECALQSAIQEYLSVSSGQKCLFYWAPFFLTSLGRRPLFDSGDTPCLN